MTPSASRSHSPGKRSASYVLVWLLTGSRSTVPGKFKTPLCETSHNSSTPRLVT